MKKNILLIALFIFSIFAITGCKKTNSKPAVTLVAKWNIVSDTINYSGFSTSTTTYKGVAGDYFDFRANGLLYIKEGAKLDTEAFNLEGDTSVIIQNYNYNFPIRIKPLTIHNLTLNTGFNAIPGNSKDEVITLER